MKLIRIAVATLSALISGAAFAELPHIKNVTVNPTPPGAKVTAVYLEIHNPGDKPLTLSKVSSPLFSRVEIHKTTVVDDVAKMRRQDGVNVPADETLVFTHGGYHIMLMDLEAPMIPGAQIPLVFHTNQGEISIEVRVAEKIVMPKDGHGDMKHDNMKDGAMEHSTTKHDDMNEGAIEMDGMKHDDITK